MFFFIRETMKAFNWHLETSLLFFFILAYFQSIEECEELENENSFFLPLSFIEEAIHLSAYKQSKALKELEEKKVLKVRRKGIKNKRFIELSLGTVQDFLSDTDERYEIAFI